MTHTLALTAAIALSAACLALPGLAQEDSKVAPPLSELVLGVWCGSTDEHEYFWTHSVFEDGTFATRFESHEDAEFPFAPYWEFGRWSRDGTSLLEVAQFSQDAGGEREPMLPPMPHLYQIESINTQERRLYSPSWDTTFVSTRNCDTPMG